MSRSRGRGSEKVLTIYDRGRGGEDHVTSHFQFFHNSQFNVLFDNFIIHSNKLKLQISPSEL